MNKTQTDQQSIDSNVNASINANSSKKPIIGITTRTDIKVGSAIGDFWQKIKGLYPG